ncbi:MAG TPA: DUF4936 family protein [Burkholderiales bacterium]|nr:DUF4936 family protein [Burkholderiales bacterium]
MNYYVYYKVEPARAEALRADVQSLFERVERACGVRGRWMRRRDDPETFMEVYEDVQDAEAFESLLEREGAAFGFARKVERFIFA